MTEWQSSLARGLAALESRFDALRLAFKSRFGTNRLPMIQPYIGHATTDAVFLRGRVLFNKNITPSTVTDSLWTNLKNTYKRFESDEIPFAKVRVSVDNLSQEVICDEEGFFKVVLHPEERLTPDGYWQNVQLQVIETPIPGLPLETAAAVGRVIVPPPDAQFAVVSDLDDTIVRTEVLKPLRMMRNTFLGNAYTRRSFAGVAAFYRALQAGTHNTHNPIFYVSSSPWNLYDVIIEFYRLQGIPLGPVYLRHMGITQRMVGTPSHMQHKLSYIERLMEHHANLNFILIGDSGQRDAYIYREVVRRNPGRVLAIYIRDVASLHHAAAIRAIAAELQRAGVVMLLATDTIAEAEHAAANGYITDEALATVRSECKRTP